MRLLPVRVAESGAAREPAAGASERRRAGTIEIERDGIRICLDADASIAMLRRVVAALRG
jgi:hypothetical protein